MEMTVDSPDVKESRIKSTTAAHKERDRSHVDNLWLRRNCQPVCQRVWCDWWIDFSVGGQRAACASSFSSGVKAYLSSRHCLCRELLSPTPWNLERTFLQSCASLAGSTNMLAYRDERRIGMSGSLLNTRDGIECVRWKENIATASSEPRLNRGLQMLCKHGMIWRFHAKGLLEWRRKWRTLEHFGSLNRNIVL